MAWKRNDAPAGPPGYDPKDDPAPDVFAVQWKGEKVRVRHYPSILATRECCHIVGQITKQDHAHPFGPQVGCLTRLRMPCGVEE